MVSAADRRPLMASVPEVPRSSEEHRGAGGICDRDALGVAQGPTGLGERRDARAQADLNRVREWEEGVRAARGAPERVVTRETAGLLDGLAGRVNPGNLARAHADERAVLHEDDGVGRDPSREAPGEIEVGALAVRGRTPGREGPGRRVVRDDI